MTDRRRDSLKSGEITRRGDADGDAAADGTQHRLPLGLSVVARHARELSRLPVPQGTESLGRKRLMAAASLEARPLSEPANSATRQEARAFRTFTPEAVWAALRQHGAWVAAAAVLLLSLSGYAALRPQPLTFASLKTLSALDPQAPAPASQAAALTYSTRGGQPSASNYLVAPAHESASLKFSDGSEVTAAPGARLRVDSTHSRGARVLVEQGVARASVTHRDQTNWVFVAGPFDVRITGTSFTLSWDGAEQVLDLTLHEGSVEVDSALGANGIKVKTGQRFHASVTEGTMQLLAADSPDLADATTPEASSSDNDASDILAAASDERGLSRSARRLARREHSGRVARRRGWRERVTQAREARETGETRRRHPASRADRQDEETLVEPQSEASFTDLVRAGAFEQVVSAATQAGLAKTLQRNSAQDVRALADAARYLHRTELAVRSLTVLRTRFPGTHQSSAAAFLLGRTYENAEQLEAARHFYELYERETPGGEFAAEALAGRMRTVTSLQGSEAGSALARQYLQRYPRGVHSKTARALARSSK